MPIPTEPPTQLDRTSSRPSLTHSSSTATSDETPNLNQHLCVDKSTIDRFPIPITPTGTHHILNPSQHVLVQSGSADSYPSPIEEIRLEAEEGRKAFGRLNFSRSMQNLKAIAGGEKKDRGKSGPGRERAKSSANRTSPPIPTPVPPLPTTVSFPKTPTIVSPPKSQTKPVRPPNARSGSSFSSFIRKLTGKSESSKAPAAPPAKAQPHKSTSTKALSPSTQHKQLAAPPQSFHQAGLQKPILPKIITSNSNDSNASRAPQSLSISYPSEKPTPAPSRSVPTPQTDPASIPLPPSPTLSALFIPPESDSASSDKSVQSQKDIEDDSQVPLAFSAQSIRSSVTSEPRLKRINQSGMLSLEGFEFEEEEDEGEEEDLVQPLRTLTIATRASPTLSSSSSAMVTTPSMSSPNSHEFGLLSPISPIESSPSSPSRYDGLALAGSSPPRKAPIGKGPVKLGREKSKWRKSVMNISENLAPSLNRKASQKPPPSSYDAYEAQQRQIKQNRVSCAPTLHSTASVAAEMREVRDKEQEEVMETFFLS